jgi:hypothetical protein
MCGPQLDGRGVVSVRPALRCVWLCLLPLRAYVRVARAGALHTCEEWQRTKRRERVNSIPNSTLDWVCTGLLRCGTVHTRSRWALRPCV